MTKKNTTPCGECKSWSFCTRTPNRNYKCEFGGIISDQFTVKSDCHFAKVKEKKKK